MRVLHVPYSYPPDPPGGTEIYVAGIAAEQAASGDEATIAAPGRETASYEYDGLPVRRFLCSARPSLSEIYGGDPVAAEGFCRILDDVQPAIVHFHALTSAVSARLAEAARQRGARTVFSYHTPAVSCGRGTLLRWGNEVCDGVLDRRRCAACVATGRGLAKPVAEALAALPPAAGRLLRVFEGPAVTALRMSELTGLQIDAFRQMMQRVDRVVALCEWTRRLLLSNLIPERKISVCRHGIRHRSGGERAVVPVRPPVRLVSLGRLEPAKGTPVVVEALRRDRSLRVTLDIYGISQGESGAHHAAELRAHVAGDQRIRLLAAVPPGEVSRILAGYHALLAPSQGFETGPLVVLEAFAAGVPVIGSDLGGIAELVTNGKDGLLVNPYSSAAEWSETLGRVAAEPGLLDELRKNIQPPRHSRQAAVELSAIYAEVLRSSAEESVP